MSDLLNSASLVVIPSGYKEDTVYSVVPSDGSGDLSFTRASNGTRVNSAGLVEVCPWNLLQNSENFTSNWNPNSNTITANTTTAPNGTTTADTFTLIPSGDSSVYQAVNGESNNYTTSVYAKYVSGDKYLYFFSQLNSQGAKVWFDIQNGTVSNQLSGFTGTIENVGNGWYKCSMYNTTASISDYIQFGISTTNSSRTLSNNSVAYFWGAQVNVGTAKPYFPTTDRLNVPRLTYQNGGGGCPSLLLEKQSTNLFTYSEELQTGTGGTITVTPNTAISPDGTQNADSFSTSGYLVKTLSATAGTYTYSVFAKYLSQNTINISIYDGAYYDATYNVITGVVSSASAGVTASIQNFGNGWYRCIMTATTANNVTEVDFNTGNVYVWGCQFEAGSYATSYISTQASSATRVADACFKTGISSLIGQTEGTIFIDVNTTINGDASSYAGIALNDGTSSNILAFGYYQDGRIQAVAFVGGSLVVNINLPIFGLTTGNHKFAFSYKLNDYVFYVDGVQVGSDISASVPATSALNLYDVVGANIAYSQAVLFKTRLTNAELASLTTI